jgi:hypothetical protein
MFLCEGLNDRLVCSAVEQNKISGVRPPLPASAAFIYGCAARTARQSSPNFVTYMTSLDVVVLAG